MGQEPIHGRGGVTYRPLTARNLLNKCDSTRVPFEWTVNPYRGCAIGCRYCFAAYTHEYLGLPGDNGFHTTIYAKEGGLDAAARQMPALVRRGQRIALGTATDPYQPGEAQLGVTRRFLERASQVRGLRLGISTKGALVLRDVDLLRRIHERGRLSVHISLISPRADLLRRLEPWAPSPAVRLEVMRRLCEAGLDVGLSLAPVLPALTDDENDLDELLEKVAATGVRKMWSGILFLRSPTKENYFAWLAQEFPRYLEAYRRAYEDRAYLRGAYAERVQSLVRRLREKHGLRGGEANGRATPPRRPEQMGLFGSRMT
jgi:DNA repair photolyase